MRKNAWTTLEEFAYLQSCIPQFLKQQAIRVVASFLAVVATTFLEKFPSRRKQFDRETLVEKLRTWFGNHTRDSVRGDDARHVLDLTGRANRQPVALQPAQAYSILYYNEGSPLWHEIHDLYELYKSGDPTTVARLGPLFKNPNTPPAPNSETTSPANAETASDTNGGTTGANTDPSPNAATRHGRKTRKSGTPKTTKTTCKTPPFVHFQQTIIREKLKTMSAEEEEAVESHIASAFASATKVWESPWLSSLDEDADVNELKMQYYQKNIVRVHHSLQVVGDEIARQTSFKTFFLWGGSSPLTGSISTTVGHTGKTIDGEQSFIEYLGPTFTEVEEKFRKWVQLTYTNEELQRHKAFHSSFMPSPAAPGNTTIPAPSQTTGLTPAQLPLNIASTLAAPSPSATPVPPSRPAEPVSPSPPVESSPPSPPVELVPPPSSPPVEQVPPSPPVEQVPLSPPVEPAPLSPTVTSVPPSLSIPPSPIPTSPTTPSRPEVVSPAPPYPKFITPAVLEHLNSITNVSGWPGLIQNYLEFELASPSKSVTRLPSNGRPYIVDDWLKDPAVTRLIVPNTASYAESWKAWWIGCQPPTRAETPWPFPQEPGSDIQWGRLLNGGKHGIFLFVMALSWWAISLDPVTNSPELAEAISDLSWVARQLTASFVVPPKRLLTPPATSEGQESSRGKRKVKLTEKTLDGGDRVQKRFWR